MQAVFVGLFCVASVSVLALCASCAYVLLGDCAVSVFGSCGIIFANSISHCQKQPLK